MANNSARVFLDANIVIRSGKPPGGPQIIQLHELVEAGLISIVTTDHTILEVAKQHVRNDYGVVKVLAHNRLRKLASAKFGIELPELSDSDLHDTLWKEYESSTKKMFGHLNADILPVDDILSSQVLKSYAKNEGFFAKDVKRNQFPDAFIFERLLADATEERPITIISDDSDFDRPCDNADHIELIKSIPVLLERLGLDDEAPDPEPFLEQHTDEVLKIVNTELADWSLYADDVEDAYIEVVDTQTVELIDLVAFGTVAKNGTVLIIGTANIVADVVYTHPSWDNAIWDSEEKCLIPFEVVSGETAVDVQADFSMSIVVDDNGALARINEFEFRNDRFMGIELYPQDY